jgi:DNA-binding NarL/FixJ family response regulator
MDAMPFHDRAGITCVVADDHPPILDCLTRYLESAGFDVLGTALDGARALEAVTSLAPVVCIADVRMPKLDGLELARQIAKVAP